MSRPRKPTVLLERSGAFVKNPKRGRERSREPKAIGDLGDPPKCLNPEQKAIWHEVAALLAPGVACRSDRMAFEMMVRLSADARTGRISAGERGLLLSYQSKFGMTPSDRSRVGGEPGDKPRSALDSILRSNIDPDEIVN